jgi:hypothetical protein
MDGTGWWSWLLTGMGVIWLWLAGSGRWWAWGLGIATECCWIAYALATRQYGFVVGAIAYGAIHARNLHVEWRSRTA